MLQIDTPGGAIFIDETTGQQVTSESLRALARAYALEAGVDPDLFERLIEAESGFNPAAVNASSGATGIAQIMPATAAQPGYGVAPVDPTDPADSLRFGAQYLRAMLDQTGGDYRQAVSAYNGGLGNVQNGNWQNPAWGGYGENSAYVSKIVGGGGGGGGGRLMRPQANPTTTDAPARDTWGRDSDSSQSGTWERSESDTSGPATPTGGPKRVVKTVPLPNGDTQVNYSDGTFEVVPKNASAGAQSGNNAADVAQRDRQLAEQKRQFDLQLANATTPAERAAILAEQQRQFNETMGMDKAKFNTQINLDKGKTLLNLGSRPDTLIKYLYALRGKQTPQGFENTTQNLPGFENVLNPGTRPAAGTTGATPPAAPPLTPTPIPAYDQIRAALQQTQQRVAQAETLAPNSGVAMGPLPNIGPGGSAPSLAQPPLQLAKTADGRAQVQIPGGGVMPTDAVIANVQTGAGTATPVSLSDWAVKKGFNLAPYADGGVIPEPVIGTGVVSGRTYTFGEEGPEEVKPAKKPYANSGTGSFRGGGTIGYNPQFAPPSLFNPSGLAGNIAGPINPNGNPNFPQFNHFTGGGQSLIPSAQRLNQSLGSERSLYAGLLQDEAGVVPDDIFEMAKKLAPQVTGLRTPRFAN